MELLREEIAKKKALLVGNRKKYLTRLEWADQEVLIDIKRRKTDKELSVWNGTAGRDDEIPSSEAVDVSVNSDKLKGLSEEGQELHLKGETELSNDAGESETDSQTQHQEISDDERLERLKAINARKLELELDRDEIVVNKENESGDKGNGASKSVKESGDEQLKKDTPADLTGETGAVEENESFQIVAEDIRDNQTKVYTQMRLYLKHLLQTWTDTLQDPELLLETKRSIVPLLVRLKRQDLDPDIFASLSTTLKYLQDKNYLMSNDSYLKLSIGNACWPIGVMNVGIHARSAHSRMEQQKSNIMSDAKTRAWLMSLKRLISFCERNDM